ncbi:hypothetical protein [Sorangium atrum]|uniref:Uncharacterized protein n=1 Tax=Sorangium atrum TaxID=2995308 RepID=A0ABT5BZT1_9BACT|nr:hypothetical protein [Sorangium aterium]MDC0679667.1 hypothetical protein [Sorangium aterium]
MPIGSAEPSLHAGSSDSAAAAIHMSHLLWKLKLCMDLTQVGGEASGRRASFGRATNHPVRRADLLTLEPI